MPASLNLARCRYRGLAIAVGAPCGSRFLAGCQLVARYSLRPRRANLTRLILRHLQVQVGSALTRHGAGVVPPRLPPVCAACLLPVATSHGRALVRLLRAGHLGLLIVRANARACPSRCYPMIQLLVVTSTHLAHATTLLEQLIAWRPKPNSHLPRCCARHHQYS